MEADAAVIRREPVGAVDSSATSKKWGGAALTARPVAQEAESPMQANRRRASALDVVTGALLLALTIAALTGFSAAPLLAFAVVAVALVIA